ncbi:NADH-quinone oxidoreductase subunit M [Synechococcus sp. R50.1]|uniref:NADH-quinone oxidoreductase subunit M n=1 Tax=Synechococcus sp. R50.1 TaxID=2969649 RepID=UPI0039C0CC28
MLSLLIGIPLLGSILIGLIPEQAGKGLHRALALGFGWVLFGLSAGLLLIFDPHLGSLQLAEKMAWIPQLGLVYEVGVDGISLPLVVMTGLLVLMAIWASGQVERPRLYYSLVLMLAAAVAGAFLAQNLLLFFLFYEVELIPLYLLIAIWGGPQRTYAATKFLIYTALSGILLLVGFFGLSWLSDAHSFTYTVLQAHPLPLVQQTLLLIPILLGLAIKIPLVPFHTWLPDAHVEASTPISVLLAGLLLKLGTYGLLRFGLQLLPDAWQQAGPWLAGWAVVNVLYGSLNALVQQDMKKLVAYSSIAHMGYILLATAAATPLSLVGSVFQMVSHGLISALLFLLVGAVYTNTGTRDLRLLQGLLNPERGLPLIGSLMVLGVMASGGTPGMVGFIAEFAIFRGSFPAFPLQTLLCMMGTGLTAAYFLLMVNRAFFGRLSEVATAMSRQQVRERLPAAVLATLVVVLGLQPAWATQWIEPTTADLAKSVALSAPATEGVVGKLTCFMACDSS